MQPNIGFKSLLLKKWPILPDHVHCYFPIFFSISLQVPLPNVPRPAVAVALLLLVEVLVLSFSSRSKGDDQISKDEHVKSRLDCSHCVFLFVYCFLGVVLVSFVVI